MTHCCHYLPPLPPLSTPFACVFVEKGRNNELCFSRHPFLDLLAVRARQTSSPVSYLKYRISSLDDRHELDKKTGRYLTVRGCWQKVVNPKVDLKELFDDDDRICIRQSITNTLQFKWSCQKP